MLLPAQSAAVKRYPVLLIAAGRCCLPEPLAKFAQVNAISLGALLRSIEGKVQHARRHDNGRERACMHLAKDDRPQGMWSKARVVRASDHDFAAHGRLLGSINPA